MCVYDVSDMTYVASEKAKADARLYQAEKEAQANKVCMSHTGIVSRIARRYFE